MNFDAIIQLVTDNLIISVVVAFVVLFLFYRLIRTARMYLGAKSYVKKARKLDKRKFNGLTLVDKIAKKRKKNTNSFKKLRGRAKKWVRKYLTHKFEELPIITRYSRGKLFKRSKNHLMIIVKNERKTLKKIKMKKGMKQLIEITNKYECLDEVIAFMHNLPEAILEDQDYDIFVSEADIMITYVIK
jgi:hypothetical protein